MRASQLIAFVHAHPAMARLTRLTFAHETHLVLIHASASRALFVDDVDRRRFLEALLSSARAAAVSVHAYALLDEQIALLATPDLAQGIEKMMQRLGRRYVAAFNARHHLSGPLWRSRYGTAAIDMEALGRLAFQFVEQAPVRAGRVSSAQEWPWSSAPHHTGGARSLVLREHQLHWKLGNTPFEREARHAAVLTENPDSAEMSALLTQVMRGWPIGPSEFKNRLAASSGRDVVPRKRGRPRKESGAQS